MRSSAVGRLACAALASVCLASLAIVVSGASWTLSAQEPTPTFRTEANYVRVDVYPTHDGQPVTDLTRDDFEVLENRVPQRLDAFEHVVVRGGGPQETRREPNSVAESRQAATDPRARVFVLFLDVNHVEVDGSHNIRKPLTDALDKIIGPDDLVAVMTPEMPASAITFARKTTTIDGILSRYWNWGERGQINSKDPREDQYRACFSGMRNDTGIADEMIERRREKMTLDALQDLVRYLRGVREERKAVIAITDGWQLFRQNSDLARPITSQPLPSGPDVAIDPRTGRLTTKDTRTTSPSGTSPQDCDNDRIQLAQIDDEREFRDILDEANRANASFYPVDPRGLVVFDTPIVGPDSTGPTATPMTPLAADRQMLLARLNSLRTLAEATDGLAIVDSNNLAGGMQRIVADLTSYYLLGYYSTGKLDGKFHSITVRVKRPGVQVRARRGYLAASANEVGRSASDAGLKGLRHDTTPEPGAAAFAAAVSTAIDRLAPAAQDQPLRVAAASGWATRGTAQTTSVWIAAEITDRLAGGALDAEVLSPTGASVAGGRGRIEPGSTSALVRIDAAEPLPPGDYTVRVHLEAGSGGATTTVPVAVLAAPRSSGAILVRRGQATGNREVATADPRFRRGDRLRIDVPAAGDAPFEARLLDRTGKPLPVPVAAATRQDPDGTRWNAATLALTPLAQGDYVIELSGGSGGEQTLVAFRVVQ